MNVSICINVRIQTIHTAEIFGVSIVLCYIHMTSIIQSTFSSIYYDMALTQFTNYQSILMHTRYHMSTL